MKTIIQILSSGTIAYVVMLILVPVLKKIALRAGLTDKPNSRKVHHEPVPLVGGIAMVLTVSLLGPTSLLMFPVSQELWMVLNSSVVLFVIGVIDDKFDLKAKYKLVIQLFCAFMVAAAGVRLTSLYGLFGMHELPIFTQYAITVVLITGVVNAFNLMDGIDGMVGLLGFIGLGMMSIFSFFISQYAIAVLMATFMGAMVGFLRFNFAREKIFMGDAGSLLVGNLLIGSGIYLLNFTQSKVAVNSGFMYALIGFFALPVLDALRVFLGRMKKGLSPFSADKSHIHHLFLLMGLTHRQIAFLIAAINLSILVATLLMNGALSLTVSVLIIVVVFSMLGFVLNLNKKVKEWTVRLRQLED